MSPVWYAIRCYFDVVFGLGGVVSLVMSLPSYRAQVASRHAGVLTMVGCCGHFGQNAHSHDDVSAMQELEESLSGPVSDPMARFIASDESHETSNGYVGLGTQRYCGVARVQL